MPSFEPRDPAFESRVRTSFARMRFMETIGAELARVAPGEVEVALAIRDGLSQPYGFVHVGVVAAIADTACGYATLALAAPGDAVLTVEFKLNLLAPARGERLLARGRVLKPGRSVTVCMSEILAYEGGRERSVATTLATMMTVRDRPDVPVP
jgi:uncharacterized protein (TIGR00369 family)